MPSYNWRYTSAWINGALLPSRKTGKKDAEAKPLAHIVLHGYGEPDSFALLKAKAEGNLLCRELTVLPPNELTPGLYRKHIQKLAAKEGWKYTEFDLEALRKMGAGAFVAVAQGSDRKTPPSCICGGASKMRRKPWRWLAKAFALIPAAII